MMALHVLKKVLLITLTTIITFLCFGDEDIKLGTSAVFSGSSRDLGVNYFIGGKVYFDRINNQGGIKGRNIKLIVYDDKYEPNPCIDNTIDLIKKDNVDLLFNYVGTPTTTAILPLLKIFDNEKIVLFGNLTGAGGQRSYPYSSYVFNIRASYKEETSKLVEYFIKRGYLNIGIVYQIDAYGRSGYEGVKERLHKSGYEIAAEATYVRGEKWNSSMTIQLDHLKDSGVEAIISVGSYEACAALIRDARVMGINVPIANISFVGAESLIALLRSSRVSLENLYFTQVVPDYMSSKLPIIIEYNNIVSENHLEPNFISLEGFINAKLLVEVLKESDLEIKRANIKNIIENMEPVDIGLGRKVQFTSKDHQLLHDVHIFSVKSDGTMEVLR